MTCTLIFLLPSISIIYLDIPLVLSVHLISLLATLGILSDLGMGLVGLGVFLYQSTSLFQHLSESLKEIPKLFNSLHGQLDSLAIVVLAPKLWRAKSHDWH